MLALTPLECIPCQFNALVLKSFLSLHLLVDTVQYIISPNANVVEGQCVNRNRYYCSAPPRPTVVSPTAPYLKYNLYGDNLCTVPSWYSSYNETVGCYQHGPLESFERMQCTDTTVTMTKYFNTFPNPNPTWCSAPYSQDYQFKLGVCAPYRPDSTRFVKIDSCTFSSPRCSCWNSFMYCLNKHFIEMKERIVYVCQSAIQSMSLERWISTPNVRVDS
jgi:hypothetical protein